MCVACVCVQARINRPVAKVMALDVASWAAENSEI